MITFVSRNEQQVNPNAGETTMLTLAQVQTLAMLTVSDVLHVYSGKPGKCACGCSGNHRYASAFRAEASKRRGYEVSDDEVNDRQVAKVLKLVQGAAAETSSDAGDSYFSAVVDGRLYVVYPR
jgi:hypothetical protein